MHIVFSWVSVFNTNEASYLNGVEKEQNHNLCNHAFAHKQNTILCADTKKKNVKLLLHYAIE